MPEATVRDREIEEIQERYGKRIKQRLAEPQIDVLAARDGILDCYVATYFGGLKQGISGYLGIDASEEQVSRVAKALFKKRMKEQGSSFDSPSIDALDKVKSEVDRELHFHELPGELRGLHDQVCSLMLGKAEGNLDHHADRSSVQGTSRPTQVSGNGAGAPVQRVQSAPPSSPSVAPTTVSSGLRGSLGVFLHELADGSEHLSPEQLRAALAKATRLVDVLEDMG